MRLAPYRQQNADALLAAGIEALALSIGADQQQRLLRYLQLIEKWNKVYNLTAIRDRQQMVVHHLFDSLAILPYLRANAVLDIGSGVGVPGVVIAIVRPDLQVTLLDSSRKKSVFLQQVIMELALANTSVVCTRLEAYHNERGFDTIVSRAVASTAVLARHGVPLLAPAGVLLAMKGTLPSEQVAESIDGAIVRAIVRLHIPGLVGERHLLVMTKA